MLLLRYKKIVEHFVLFVLNADLLSTTAKI